jgi:hypothetical protein
MKDNEGPRNPENSGTTADPRALKSQFASSSQGEFNQSESKTKLGIQGHDLSSGDKDFRGFKERIRHGKIRICEACGGIMIKSCRPVLSRLSGCLLVVFGLVLFAMYGLMVNFTQLPWFLKFIMPGMYYMGAIFTATGVIFFFIRERVWLCEQCRDISKR